MRPTERTQAQPEKMALSFLGIEPIGPDPKSLILRPPEKQFLQDLQGAFANSLHFCQEN
jgi:hypothetical protein